MTRNTRTALKNFTARNLHFRRIFTLLMYILLLDVAFIFLYPFLYMVITSFKSYDDLNDISVKWLLNSFDVTNYTTAAQLLNYFPRLLNTAVSVALCTVGHVFSCSFIGYGFARYRFRGQKFFFGALMLSIVVPVQTIIVPLYIVYSKLGLIPGQLPVILPTFLGFGLRGALFIFMFRQFFYSLPPSLEEAAAIDGCGAVKTFFKIALPTARSSVLVCIVLSVVWHWNDFFEPTLYIQRQKDYYLSLMLPTIYEVINDTAEQSEQLYTAATLMAAVVLIVVPLFVAYMAVQRQFMQSVETSGITGE